jgi:hypothetical protein
LMNRQRDTIPDAGATRASRSSLAPIAAIGIGLIATILWWGFLAWEGVNAAALF